MPNDAVKWNACGYRLPTEAEWEKAARGGVEGHRFPWSDTDEIQHARANYQSSSDQSYDTSPTRGLNPACANGDQIPTCPVGSFAPNGYGLYDMAGNAWEWVWDRYSGDYSSSSDSDPRGREDGVGRLMRGGGWNSTAFYCRIAYRGVANEPRESYGDNGFRVVRPTGQLQNAMTRYDPDKHHRRSIRLREFDSSRPGAYFVTICTRERECLLGDVVNGEMVRNEDGRVVQEEWARSGEIRQEIRLDEFVVMPNHVHGVIVITNAIMDHRRGTACRAPTEGFGQPVAGSLPTEKKTDAKNAVGNPTESSLQSPRVANT